MALQLGEVFTINGTPTYTFVEPKKYRNLLLNLRSKGRGLVVEGPSGIGKTTAIEKAISEAGLDAKVCKLSARSPEDLPLIAELPKMKNVGIVLIDDFHKLPTPVKSCLADHMKLLADTASDTTKIIVLGINKAGDSLIHFAPDLVNRLDVVRFENEPDEKLEQLLAQGENALNTSIAMKADIVKNAQGSFYIAQLLATEVCLAANIMEETPEKRIIDNVSFEAVKANVWDRLDSAFRKRTEDFCRGTKLRREGRAPYLHVLNWLANSQSWTLDLRSAMRENPSLRGSVGQVIDKGFLKHLIDGDDNIRQTLHFDENAVQLTIEDPQFLFYVRNIPWRQFAIDVGFLSVEFERRYDFALSFAGSDRHIAHAIAEKLTENEVEVFYDKYEQARILAEDVEEYLRPVYQSEANFVIALLGPDYPKRIWTKFESNAFKDRFKDGKVVPIWFSDAQPGIFDESTRVGGISFDRKLELGPQVDAIVACLLEKLSYARNDEARIEQAMMAYPAFPAGLSSDINN